MLQPRRVQTRSVTMYPEQWAALDEYAWQRRVSPSEILRQLIEEHIPPAESTARAVAQAG